MRTEKEHFLYSSERKSVVSLSLADLSAIYDNIISKEKNALNTLIARHFHFDKVRTFRKCVIEGNITGTILFENLNFIEVDFSKITIDPLHGKLILRNCTFNHCIEHDAFEEVISMPSSPSSVEIYPSDSVSRQNSSQRFFGSSRLNATLLEINDEAFSDSDSSSLSLNQSATAPITLPTFFQHGAEKVESNTSSSLSKFISTF